MTEAARGQRRAPLSQAMSYSLRSGISVCEVTRRLLFLDIDADRYFALAGAAERAVLSLVHNAPLSDDDRLHLARLAERGVLECANGPDHPVAATISPQRPEVSLLDHIQPSGHLGESVVAAAAIAASIVRVKRLPLRINLSSAVSRRGPAGPPDLAQLGRIAGAFDRAGSLISAHDRCLPQSLAVMRTIAARGGWAQVVLGVTLGPFAAHCWVQHDRFIVNDRVDRVRCYTPILVV